MGLLQICPEEFNVSLILAASLVTFFAISECRVEHGMPFRGLFSGSFLKEMSSADLKHYTIAWAPAWWIMMASSTFMLGIGFTCSIWAFAEYASGNRDLVASPFLLGVSAVIGAIGTILIPIVTLIFKDRSETRNINTLKEELKKLETELKYAKFEHSINRSNIQKLADLTQLVIEDTPNVERMDTGGHIHESRTDD